MINNKKKINKIKTETFLNEFPIIFLLQYNNFTVNDWLRLKQKIQELNGNANQSSQISIEIFNIKNSLLKKIFVNEIFTKNRSSSFFYTKKKQKSFSFGPETVQSLCQGPNFILGCKDEKQLTPVWNFIHSESKLLFISCLYKNQVVNHLDLQILLKTDFSIYNSFLQNLDKKTELYDVLEYNCKLYPLLSIQENLLNVFNFLKEFKKTTPQ